MNRVIFKTNNCRGLSSLAWHLCNVHTCLVNAADDDGFVKMTLLINSWSPLCWCETRQTYYIRIGSGAVGVDSWKAVSKGDLQKVDIYLTAWIYNCICIWICQMACRVGISLIHILCCCTRILYFRYCICGLSSGFVEDQDL